jgi:hypothetical protein
MHADAERLAHSIAAARLWRLEPQHATERVVALQLFGSRGYDERAHALGLATWHDDDETAHVRAAIRQTSAARPAST